MDKTSSKGMGPIMVIAATLAILSFSTTWIMAHAQEVTQVNSQENVTGIQNTTLTTNDGEEDDKGVAEEGSGEDSDEPGDIDVGDDDED